MSQGLVLEFTKMHGAGNDFIVVDNRFFRFSADELSEIAARFCPRRMAIGADGLLALDLDDSSETNYRMLYFNADGSRGEMCGNGARCLAAFAYASGVVAEPLSFSTDAGRYEAYVGSQKSGLVRLIMPAPTEVKLDFSSVGSKPGIQSPVDFVMAGVPHAVCYSDAVDEEEVVKLGSIIRRDPSFSSTQGTNVDFVEVRADGTDHLLIRTYERGVEAETLACGTGAISAFVAARARDLLRSDEAVVRMKGGTLRVGLVPDSDQLFLEGPVTFAFRGTVIL